MQERLLVHLAQVVLAAPGCKKRLVSIDLAVTRSQLQSHIYFLLFCLPISNDHSLVGRDFSCFIVGIVQMPNIHDPRGSRGSIFKGYEVSNDSCVLWKCVVYALALALSDWSCDSY
eukprot:scaffold300965_cov14-Tisochrysis_lutea.AAC.1